MRDFELIPLKTLHSLVCQELSRDISRRTFYRWRCALGFTRPPYAIKHVAPLVYFGRLVGVGLSVDEAYERSLQKIEENNNG